MMGHKYGGRAGPDGKGFWRPGKPSVGYLPGWWKPAGSVGTVLADLAHRGEVQSGRV
jgi:hypothetical protein